MYRNTDLGELWQIVQSANFGIIAASLIFGLLGNTIGIKVGTFCELAWLSSSPGQYLVCYPGKLCGQLCAAPRGDIWRCGVVSRYDKIPFGKTFETFLVDKVVDLLAGLLLVIVSVFCILIFCHLFSKQSAVRSRYVCLF